MSYRRGIIVFAVVGLSACSGKTSISDSGNATGAAPATGDGGGTAPNPVGLSGTNPTAGGGANPIGGGGSDPVGMSGGEPELPPSSSPKQQLYGLAEQGGTFVAVGSKGGSGTATEAIFASSDGSKWQRVHSGPLGALYGLAAGNGRYVATTSVGSSPSWTKVYTSEDGFAWVEDPEHLPNFRNLVFGNGVFVATDTTLSRFYLSTDATSWDPVEVPDDGLAFSAFTQLAFGGGHFVAARSGGTYVSDDGKQWMPVSYVGKQIMSLQWALDRFVMVDKDDCCFGEIPERIKYSVVTSSDAVTWDQRPLDEGQVFPLWNGESKCLGLSPQDGKLVGPMCSTLGQPVGYAPLVVGQEPLRLLAISLNRETLQASSDGGTWSTVLSAD